MVGNRGVRKCIEQEFLIRRAMGVISDDNARATKTGDFSLRRRRIRGVLRAGTDLSYGHAFFCRGPSKFCHGWSRVIGRMGNIAQGPTVSDCHVSEKQHQISTQTSLMHRTCSACLAISSFNYLS
jgi:hypothetical protein